MEVRINLNEKVKFKLSERGKEIYRHRYDGYGFEYNREPELDDDGYMSMQLWTFMQIFGKYMVMGMSEVLKPLEIIYENEALGDVEPATTTDCISRIGTIKALCTECTCEDGCCADCTEVAVIKGMPSMSEERANYHNNYSYISYNEDCISRKDAVEAIEGVDWYHVNSKGELVHGSTSEEESWYKADEIYKAIESLPPVESKRQKGEWVFNPKDAIDLMFTLPKCSECGFESADGGNFCSNCGADMKGGTKNE